MKKRIRNGCFPRIFTIFAKNTAHNERRLRKNAYLCIVAENPSQTGPLMLIVKYMATIKFDRERFLQSIREYRQQKREWQERINKQLDAKEEEIRRIKASHYYEIA